MDIETTSAHQADGLIFVAAFVTSGLTGKALNSVLSFCCSSWAVRIADSVKDVLSVTVTRAGQAPIDSTFTFFARFNTFLTTARHVCVAIWALTKALRWLAILHE